jgi:hypothetical protein
MAVGGPSAGSGIRETQVSDIRGAKNEISTSDGQCGDAIRLLADLGPELSLKASHYNRPLRGRRACRRYGAPGRRTDATDVGSADHY